MPDPMTRLECLTALFGAHYARQFAQGGYQELMDASLEPGHPLMADTAEPQRNRLRAVVRLCQLYYREQEWTPQVVTGIGDVGDGRRCPGS